MVFAPDQKPIKESRFWPEGEPRGDGE